MNSLPHILRALSRNTHYGRFAIILTLPLASIVITSIAGSTSSNSSLSNPIATTYSSAKPYPVRQRTNSLATGAWTSAGIMNDTRVSYTATLLQNGKVLVAAGYHPGAIFSAEIYDPLTNKWSSTGNLGESRFGHAATLLFYGKLLVTGGANIGGSLATAELYNPATGTWGGVASLPTAFSNHTSTLLKSGKVLLAGGEPVSNATNATALYDPITDKWSSGTLPSARSNHTATLLQNGKVLLVGGIDVNSGSLASAVLYDPATNAWTTAASMSRARNEHTATLLQNGRVLVAGGTDTIDPLASAELYDPGSNTWGNAGNLNAARTLHTATLLTDGKVLVAAGFGTGGASSELYDPTTNTWSYTAGLNDDRYLHTATLLANGKVLVTGGHAEKSYLAGAELYNPSAGISGGQKIAFGSARNGGNHDVYVMNVDGSNQTRLTTNLAYDDQPKWSPDGSKLAFISNRDGNFEIYTMNADGSSQTRLTNNPAADGFPSWSPNGTKIAFVSGDLRNPTTFEIYVMNADGTNRTRLTNDSLIDGVPSWSPDSTKIVFMGGPGSLFDVNSFEIFSMNADGSNRTRLTNNTVGDGQPSYSPDGTKILFASGNVMSPTGVEIFVMNADGSNRTQLTNNSVTDGFPAWSPDGSRIVFATGSIGDETTVELDMMNADGSNQTRLTNNSSLDWFADWEPLSTKQIQLGLASFGVGEGGGSGIITATRSGDTSAAATVNYATSDTSGANNCNAITGAASSRCDYISSIGTLHFAANETSKFFSIPIIDDAYAEGHESFTITLSNPSGATLGSPATATVTITDNDAVNGTNPIDISGYFVRLHYIDFLNREPDAPGFSFWTGEIDNCTPKPQCTEIKRINVSAAFYLSIEFQGTGYLVERVYKASYGDDSGTSTFNGVHQLSVPVVRLNEFLSDAQQIGLGVVVNQGNWQQQLENNKQAFFPEFVQRSRFTTAFPNSMTAAQFVDALNANAGNPLSPSERDQLVADLATTAKTRAQVLRAVAEDQDLNNAEFNRAFVLMQYFGYLRRNPNDPQDSDYTGYDFWLTKLNNFTQPGDDALVRVQKADMVKAFIVSAEYRNRFGP